jgi:phospholipid/cholesterol/gamma-HCH transport system substrate-binding protein
MAGSLRDRLMPATTRGRIALVAAVAAVIALVSLGLVLTAGAPGKQITAYFTEAIGVYPGSTVRILGVPVGTIDSVQPEGQHVKITMTVNAGVPVAAHADAVVVAPSVVADRYIQLLPPYTSGPQMASGAVIPATRTAVPVEVDQLYDSLEKLSDDLGPNGVNSHGALSDLINTGAENLAGNGKDLDTMITELGQATSTLSSSRGNFFSTINNLQQFTTMLADDNGEVRQVQQQLAQVSGFLAGDRQDLSGALSELGTALGQVQGFIANNRALIKTNVSRLSSITRILAVERASLAEAIDDAPLAVDNVLGAYNPVTHTLDGRGDLREIDPGGPALGSATSQDAAAQAGTTQASITQASTALPADYGNPVCEAVRSEGGSLASPLGSLCRQEQSEGGTALVPVTARQQASLPPLPLPAIGPVYGSGGTVKETG